MAIRRRSASQRARDVNLRHLLTVIADGVVVVDRAGTICFANPAAEALLGRGSGEIVGRPFGFPLVAGPTPELEIVGRSGRSSTVEMRVVETIWEEQPAWLASLRDITERKRAEAARGELYRAQAAREEAERALAARDEFLAVAAHELKTPLTRLRLSTQRALRHVVRSGGGLVLPPVVDEALLLVDRESDHIDRLITQLLDLSRIENGTFRLSPSETDLVALVEGVVAHLRGGQPELDLRLPREPLVARVDPRVFGQVVASLVANAVRYSPPSSRVEVELVRGGGAAGCEARLAVLDHAPTAGLEYEPGPFDRPVGALRRYFAGTGIGLYVSRRLVELHGGRIEVERVGGDAARIVVAVSVA